MQLSTNLRVSSLLLLLMLLIEVACFGDSAGDRTSASYRDYLAKADDGALVQVVEFIESKETGLSTRTMIETVEKTRLVLSTTLNPRSGIASYRITEDESGWWIEYQWNYGIQAPVYSKFREKSRSLKRGMRAPVRVETSDGLTIEGTYTEELEGALALVADADSAGALDSLRNAMPQNLQEALPFLVGMTDLDLYDGVFLPLSSSWTSLVVLLDATQVESSVGAEHLQEWKKTAERFRAGTRPEEADLITFVVKFNAVDVEDPLEGARAEDRPLDD